MPSAARSTWDSFDRWSEKLVKRECSFTAYAIATRSDFERLARAAARRRRLPAWLGVEDVANSLILHAWHYALERVSTMKDGTKVTGYVPDVYRSGAGAYLRRKLRQKIGKELSSARGENQHRRMGPPAPEYLSKTGEHGGPGGIPDLASGATTDTETDRALRFKHLARMCETQHERDVLDAIEKGRGDEDATIAMLSAAAKCSPAEAKKSVNEVVRDWCAELGEAPRVAA